MSGSASASVAESVEDEQKRNACEALRVEMEAGDRQMLEEAVDMHTSIVGSVDDPDYAAALAALKDMGDGKSPLRE